MPTGIGINGMGVLGRRLLRMFFEYDVNAGHNFQVNLVNDANMTPQQLQYLYNHDTVYGKPKARIDAIDDSNSRYAIITMSDGRQFKYTKVAFDSNDGWSGIPWDEWDAKYVVDCTGSRLTANELDTHKRGGANCVFACETATNVLSSGDGPTYVWGVNGQNATTDSSVWGCPTGDTIALSIALYYLDNLYTVDSAIGEHIVSYTNLNNLQDSALSAVNPQIGRAGAWNIIPCASKSGKKIGLTIPALNGKVNSFEHRCGTIAGSFTDVFANLKNDFDYDEFYLAVIKGNSCETIADAYDETLPLSVYSDDVLETSSDTIGNPAVIFNSVNYTLMDTMFVRIGVAYDALSVQAANVMLLIREAYRIGA